MSISMVAKSLAKELMNTKEYQIMINKKQMLYTHPQLGEHMKKYETKQFNIMNSKTTPDKKKALLFSLSKEYQTLLSTKELKEYTEAINAFQKKLFSIFQSLNSEINKIVNFKK